MHQCVQNTYTVHKWCFLQGDTNKMCICMHRKLFNKEHYANLFLY